MINPCKNCADRHAACHADCERYKEFSKVFEAKHAEEKRNREINGFACIRFRKNEKHRQRLEKQGRK